MLSLMTFYYKRTRFSIGFVFFTLAKALLYESIQMWAKGFKGYSSKKQNIMDLIGYISGIVWNSLYLVALSKAKHSLGETLTDDEIFRAADSLATTLMKKSALNLFMMIAWSFAVLLRGLDLFLLFERTRNFYVILLESFKDSKYFMILVIYICFFFALIQSLIDIGNENKLNIFELALVVFQDSLGAFSAPDRDEIEDFWKRLANWWNFIMFLLASNIVVLNSLIAIIGDSYEKVQLDQAFYDAV